MLCRLYTVLIALAIHVTAFAQNNVAFKTLAFYTAKNDLAHISFVHEANNWFGILAEKEHFIYDTTSDWNKMNAAVLSHYDVVLFLDTRPEAPEQRLAFENYMKSGGAWMGFHFAGFSLTASSYPQNWDWYHNEFLGSGQYSRNTWRPTAAFLKNEDTSHPISKGLPGIFLSSPNEWYSWEKDLRQNPDINVIYSIDSTSFPLGTGPKAHEIWHSGYYPVVWTNKKYNMLYINMGHNDMDYESGSNRTMSRQFSNSTQTNSL